MVDDKERNRLVQTIFVLADDVVFVIFSAFGVFGRMMGWTLDIQIIYFVLFAAALISVNIWLYHVYYEWPKNKNRSDSP